MAGQPFVSKPSRMETFFAHGNSSARITAQLMPSSVENSAGSEVDLSQQASTRYVSFSWADMSAIAPWMDDYITTRIDGPGLGVP